MTTREQSTETTDKTAPGDSAPAATAFLGESGFRTLIRAGERQIVADEPSSVGGDDAGPGPFDLLYSALGSCVLMTVRMYASRKDWPLTGATLAIHPTRKPNGPVESIRLELTLEGNLDDKQRARLHEVAGRCPVHRTLEGGVHIDTDLAEQTRSA